MLKEAAYKSLSLRYLTWKSFDLRYLPNGAPTIHLIANGLDSEKGGLGEDGRGLAHEGGVNLMASLSGDAGVLVGVVIALRKGSS